MYSKSNQNKPPKETILDKEHNLYLDQLIKAEYKESFRKAGKDDGLMAIADEGINDYFDQLEEYTSQC